MSAPGGNEDKRDEAQAILRRVDADQTSFITGTIGKLCDRTNAHFSGADAERGGAVEKWATRIGRALGAVAFVILVINLFAGWFF